MNKFFAFIVLSCFTFISKGQISPDDLSINRDVFPAEKTALTVNSTILLAGESFLYKTYNHFTSNEKSDLSKIMYVSLRNQNDSIVFTHKLKLTNSSANGNFFIPATLNSGVYNLIAYTNFSLNNDENGFAEKKIYIINPYKKPAQYNTQNLVTDTVKVKLMNSVDTLNQQYKRTEKPYSLQLNKNTYKTREKVTMTFNNIHDLYKGDYVLSVRKTHPIQIIDRGESKIKLKDDYIFRIPELRGELITGKIISNSGKKPVKNKNISLTIPGKNYIFKNAVTNENGQFFFSINQSYNTENCLIQINEPDKENYTIKVNMNELRPHLQNEHVALQLNPNIKQWLQERSVQSQIENAYFSSKQDTVIEERNNNRFYDTIGTTYVLDDYTRFNTIEETFVEVIKNASIRKKGDAYAFEVFDRATTDVSGLYKSLDLLVLMDGFVIQDNSEVVNYDVTKIKSISVFNEAYRYGPKIYSGIIVIETKKGNFKPTITKYMKEFKLTAPLSSKKFISPNYSQEDLERIPNYSVQLLWDPDIQFTNNKLVKTFYTSDITGTFQISLEGFTEAGNPVSVKKVFTVER